MSDFTHENLPLVGKHVPDYSTETDPTGNKVQVELPGEYHVGTVIDGVYVPLLKRNAAGLFADIERLKKQTPPPDEG